MEDQPAHGPTFEPVVEVRSPRVYGSFPTLFGMPLADTKGDLGGADVAFLGVPWRAPTTPSSFFVGGARANFEGTQLTPSYFRSTRSITGATSPSSTSTCSSTSG